MKTNLKENFEELIMQKIDEMIRQLNTVDLANLKNSLGLIEAVDKLYNKVTQLKSYLGGAEVSTPEPVMEVPVQTGLEIVDYNSLSSNVHPGLARALEEDRKKSLREASAVVDIESEDIENQIKEIRSAMIQSNKFKYPDNVTDELIKKEILYLKQSDPKLSGKRLNILVRDSEVNTNKSVVPNSFRLTVVT